MSSESRYPNYVVSRLLGYLARLVVPWFSTVDLNACFPSKDSTLSSLFCYWTEVVVLCGRLVAAAFALSMDRCVPWTEEQDGVRFLVLPHPSGVLPARLEQDKTTNKFVWRPSSDRSFTFLERRGECCKFLQLGTYECRIGPWSFCFSIQRPTSCHHFWTGKLASRGACLPLGPAYCWPHSISGLAFATDDWLARCLFVFRRRPA